MCQVTCECVRLHVNESCHTHECVSLHVGLQIGHVSAFTRTDTLQHTATHCSNMLQHAATCGSKVQHAATLQHAAQLARKLCETARISVVHTFEWMASLQHAATCCNMLQHAATHSFIRTFECIVWDIWMSHVTRMNQLCHTYDWVMPQV